MCFPLGRGHWQLYSTSQVAQSETDHVGQSWNERQYQNYYNKYNSKDLQPKTYNPGKIINSSSAKMKQNYVSSEAKQK